MTSDADRFWDDIAPKYRAYRHFCPLTPDEADAEFDDAPAIPLSAGDIERIIDQVVAGESPQWEPAPDKWSDDTKFDRVKDDMLAVYRDEGEPDPETDVKEDDLRKRMLNDESPDENGMDGGTTPPGVGGKDG